ncbi:MAG TPA: 6-phosphogluconolactonase [Candidatus Xenobia bacterium]|jgi:6-phosphogluconolactonase
MSDRVIVPDVAALSQEMARRFVADAKAAVGARGRVSFCLSGGSTPKSLYALLATDAYRDQVDWSKVHFFWGDERCVPPDHPDSNYRMANETLLSKIDVPAANIHRMPAEESDVAAAARSYEERLRSFFGPVEWPAFDVMLLGMGPDGHTASLFPGTQALQETRLWVVPNHVEKLNSWRLTLTYPVINHARAVYFLVGGADKAQVLKTVVSEPGGNQYPSQRIQPVDGKLTWLIEQAAASAL